MEAVQAIKKAVEVEAVVVNALEDAAKALAFQRAAPVGSANSYFGCARIADGCTMYGRRGGWQLRVRKIKRKSNASCAPRVKSRAESEIDGAKAEPLAEPRTVLSWLRATL